MYSSAYWELVASMLFLCLVRICFDNVNMQALDTLGNTKWRVNRRILSVVENLWDGGGDVAGLVNRENVSAPTSIFSYFDSMQYFFCLICYLQ